jgi:UDP-N-acetylmuramoyl-L-alanyl-D-glutamate--2,6-diaminopimelate ligase
MKRLLDLVKKDCIKSGPTGVVVHSVCYDSRTVETGSLFVALRGTNVDGHQYIANAIHNGAFVIVHSSSYEEAEALYKLYPDVAFVAYEDTNSALAQISAAFYDNPSNLLSVVGITGTNGKTTTSYILKSILDHTGFQTGLIGTISYMIGNKTFEAPHTTPEAPVFQSLLRQMVNEGCDFVVSEISSHALAQRRADCTEIKVAVFTNLTRDHLDFHRDMEDYFLSKVRLFTELLTKDGVAVINIDDPYGKRLCETLKDKNINVLTYGIESKGADITATQIVMNFRGTAFKMHVRGMAVEEVSSPLCGIANVYNCLAAAVAAVALNIPIKKIKEAIAMTSLVKGRFEKVDLGQDFLAVVDYAHTEDALERLLLTARQLLKAYNVAQKTEDMMRAKDHRYHQEGNQRVGKIITVFGCGGNRDRGKRSKMGEIASRLSDFVIVTSDNPRREDPKEIIREIERGIKGDNYIVIPDRKVAIGMAVELASSGDIVLVAGKGHEEYQEVMGSRKHFSDKGALEEAIRKTISRPSFRDWAQFFNPDRTMQNAHC